MPRRKDGRPHDIVHLGYVTSPQSSGCSVKGGHESNSFGNHLAVLFVLWGKTGRNDWLACRKQEFVVKIARVCRSHNSIRVVLDAVVHSTHQKAVEYTRYYNKVDDNDLSTDGWWSETKRCRKM